ncbi:hypothetical protein BH18CHL2_BH18CHL2_00790 [soil metagenome]
MSAKPAADFERNDQEGRAWRLSDSLREGPTILVFYRGDW